MTGDERLAKVAEVLADALCDSPVWAERHIGELEYHIADGIAQALKPLLDEFRAEDEARVLLEEADEMVRFADDTYGDDIFHRPTSEDYAAINALLKRERGHQLDGIAADCYHRAISIQAARLRDRAALAAAEPDAGAR